MTIGDVFVALETGRVDAVEFSQPAIDMKVGLESMAEIYYFPGWHQPATLFHLIVNRDAWKALSPAARAQLSTACGDNVRHGLAEGEAAQFAALKELTKRGVRLETLPKDVLAALEAAWRDVAEEEAAASPDFKTVWRSLQRFTEEYGIWRELAEP